MCSRIWSWEYFSRSAGVSKRRRVPRQAGKIRCLWRLSGGCGGANGSKRDGSNHNKKWGRKKNRSTHITSRRQLIFPICSFVETFRQKVEMAGERMRENWKLLSEGKMQEFFFELRNKLMSMISAFCSQNWREHTRALRTFISIPH